MMQDPTEWKEEITSTDNEQNQFQMKICFTSKS